MTQPSTPEKPADALSPQAVTILLAQYREAAAHHILCYSLTWQVPTVTIATSGVVTAATFSYHVPDVARVLIAAFGSVFVFAMTVALERYRMFQLCRRREMSEIEQRLVPLGADPLAWNVSEVVEDVRSGRFPVRGLYLYRLEAFRVIRSVMYAMVVLLTTLWILALADLLGAGVFD